MFKTTSCLSILCTNDNFFTFFIYYLYDMWLNVIAVQKIVSKDAYTTPSVMFPNLIYLGVIL